MGVVLAVEVAMFMNASNKNKIGENAEMIGGLEKNGAKLKLKTKYFNSSCHRTVCSVTDTSSCLNDYTVSLKIDL